MTMLTARRGLAFPKTRRRAVLIGDESESHFMARVRELARTYRWLDWHQLDSTGTRAGLPDLLLLRPPRLIFAELKSQHGRFKPEQQLALALFEQVPHVETYKWRPSDWETIVKVLR